MPDAPLDLPFIVRVSAAVTNSSQSAVLRRQSFAELPKRFLAFSQIGNNRRIGDAASLFGHPHCLRKKFHGLLRLTEPLVNYSHIVEQPDYCLLAVRMTVADLLEVIQRQLIVFPCRLHFAEELQGALGCYFRGIAHQVAVLQFAANPERLHKGSFRFVRIS